MTRQEVLKLLGKPQEVQDGDKLWGYHLRGSLLPGLSPFYIQFDERDRVESAWMQ